jgi:hypothetical protein
MIECPEAGWQLLLNEVVVEDRLHQKTRLRKMLQDREDDVVPRAECLFETP